MQLNLRIYISVYDTGLLNTIIPEWQKADTQEQEGKTNQNVKPKCRYISNNYR